MHSKRMKRNKSSLKTNCPNESILQVDLNEIKKISRNEVDLNKVADKKPYDRRVILYRCDDNVEKYITFVIDRSFDCFSVAI